MNTKLNKSDYILILVFAIVSAGLNIIEYNTNNEDLIEYLIDIPDKQV